MQAFEERFAQYFERIYRFALSLMRSKQTAEELMQQTFFKALQEHLYKVGAHPVFRSCSFPHM